MAPRPSVPLRVFIQARMSSQRFPGKMLAPFRGQPLIRQVIAAVQQGLPGVPVVVLTSTDPTDDPLAAYLAVAGVPTVRGPLDNVFERFQAGLAAFPCEAVLRICGDSPLLEARLLQAVVAAGKEGAWDVVTTIFPRTFPYGQNAELIQTRAFRAIDAQQLSAPEQEHPTMRFYQAPEHFRILNLDSGNPQLTAYRLAVDTMEDLLRLERLSPEEMPSWSLPTAHPAHA